MEIWLFVIIAEVDKLLSALMAGGDIHSTVAAEVYGKEAYGKKGEEVVDTLIYSKNKLVRALIRKDKRQKCKGVNFGIIYGIGGNGLAEWLKIPKLEAFNLRRDYIKKYPEVITSVDKCKKSIARLGYVEDLMKRRYNVDYKEAYKAVNALVQGSCAQIVKYAYLKIGEMLDRLRDYSGRRIAVLLPIHDEFINEFPKEARYLGHAPIILAAIKYYMTHIPELEKLGIVLKADIKVSNTSWEEKKGISKWMQKRINLIYKRMEKVKDPIAVLKENSVIL